MEILLLKRSLILGLTMYYFFIELLAMIPFPPYLCMEVVAGSYTG